MRSTHVANWDNDRLTEVMDIVWLTGSTNEISRTYASSEPPKSYGEDIVLEQKNRDTVDFYIP